MSLSRPPSALARARMAASAVPPALSALAARDPASLRNRVGFAAPGVPMAWVQPVQQAPRRLRMWFPTPAWLATTLLSGQPRPALPFGDPRAVTSVAQVARLGDELTRLTAPCGGLSGAPGEQALASSLLLEHMLPAALATLCNNDPPSAAMLAPHGACTFAMGIRDGSAGWIQLDGAHWRHGTGWPDARPTASLVFSSTAVAAAALAQRSDELAAVGAGDISVYGRLPLADVMGQLLNRVGRVLRGS